MFKHYQSLSKIIYPSFHKATIFFKAQFVLTLIIKFKYICEEQQFCVCILKFWK